MPEAWYVIVLAVVITLVAYTLLVIAFWIFAIPRYVAQKIRQAISVYAGKSCFNCTHFKEQYYNNELWCEEVGAGLAQARQQCGFWKQKLYEEEIRNGDD